MTKNQSSSEKRRPAAAEKKPYKKPDFRFEQIFETTALACGKVTGGVTSPCHGIANHKS